ncbi:penicillin-binding protein 1A [Planococcus lenghuensis]|uniref:Penicillin-binding protein n=1 Tax=Planococcus lenghuensis TaxID=2213202 RepID=A0A1Q2KZG9_9BACL|nr:penicillin-binding protein 1A [Planococcus lenghuensis]AQQ53598.1 penicillin-binding protein [Planococcus lenghuensis]
MSDRPTSRGERRRAPDTRNRSGNRKNNRKGKKQPAGSIHWLRVLLLTILAIGTLLFVGGAGLFAFYASSAPELDEELLRDPITPVFLAADGETEIPYITAEIREYVEYENIPAVLENAILATEDNRFYSHFGIDPIRLGGAVIANITDGFGSEGASTITQQVIKNSILSGDKTLERKAQEAYLAYQLEQEYEKEDIFEMYFNKILMSGNIYGFGTASEYFFGKPVNELELHEAALLAGMPQSPNNYNPFKNPEEAEHRRNVVLSLMEQHDKITEAEKEAAQAIPVTESLLPEAERPQPPDGDYTAFMELVEDELESLDFDFSLNEGLIIHTTLEPDVQQTVNTVLESAIFFNEEVESALTVVDTDTGAIRAIGAAREYSGDVRVNYATSRDRVNGSTIKPLISYGPAIEYLDWSTGQTVVDEEITYTDSDQVIRNFDGDYLGEMTLREALYRSRNVPSVETLKAVGPERVSEFTQKLGLDFGNIYEAAALGAPDKKISTVEMAGAFAAFGNGGIYTDPHTITKIVTRDGTEHIVKPEPVEAMEESTAYMITDILRDVVNPNIQGATGATAAVSGVDIAGKTGTTNYSPAELEDYGLATSFAPDIWFAGYSPDYSISVWSGYPSRANGINTDLREERTLAQRLFSTVMTQISEGDEQERFEQPESVVELEVEVGSDPLRLASRYTPSSLRSNELFERGTEPSSVSRQYVPVEPSAPSNLQADVNEDAQSVTLDWAFNDDRDGVRFAVSVNGSALTTTESTEYTYSGLEPGTTYTFSVVAVKDGEESDPASVSVQIAAPIVEPEPEEPVEEEPPAEESETEEPVTEEPPTEEEPPAEEPETEEPPADEGENTEEPAEGETAPPAEGGDSGSGTDENAEGAGNDPASDEGEGNNAETQASQSSTGNSDDSADSNDTSETPADNSEENTENQ